MGKADTCHDCGDPEIHLVMDDDDPANGYHGEIGLCVRCALARGVITLSDLASELVD